VTRRVRIKSHNGASDRVERRKRRIGIAVVEAVGESKTISSPHKGGTEET